MTEKIPKIFIQELLERTNLVELIGNYIILKKMGNNYHALCPFHQEKTPSFVINKSKQFFYCFGCNIHGNAIDFLMTYEGYNFLESINFLSSLHSLKIPYKNLNSKETKKYLKINFLHKILKKICKIYQKNLFQIPFNYALQYLKKRGINNNTIKKYSIGYASIQKNQIIKYLTKKNIKKKNCLETGLVSINSYKELYDRFYHRIIFPIRNQYGKINGFGGRTLNINNTAKYINSPESLIFSKKKNIYGLYELYQKIPHPPKLLIVEGYLDVLSLMQHNIPYVVGIMGTTLSKYQVNILFKISSNLIFCYDGDKIGQEAHWKSLLLILPYLYDSRTIKFIILPKFEDPHSIIFKEGEKKFKKRIKNAQSFYTFFFNFFTNKLKLNSIDSKIKLSKLVIPLIKKIPGKMIQIYLRKILGYKIGLLEHTELQNIIYLQKKKNTKKINTPIKITTMRLLISLILQNPILVKKIKNFKKIKKFHIQGISTFVKIVKYLSNSSYINTGQLLEHFRHTQYEKIFKKLLNWNNMISTKKITQTFLDLLNNLYIQESEYQYNLLITKEKNTGLNMSEKYKIFHLNKILSKKNTKKFF